MKPYASLPTYDGSLLCLEMSLTEVKFVHNKLEEVKLQNPRDPLSDIFTGVAISVLMHQ